MKKNLSYSKIARWNANYLASYLDSHIVSYPTPSNFSYMWSFGSVAGICLVIQLLTGIFLAMHYIPEIHHAFYSVEHIMRDVNYGWLLRYMHANGASFFFIAVYCHIFRGLYYGSYMYPREGLWCSGIAIFFLMMATAFMGYVLPWGQMSFWGATVITNLFSAIPGVGATIVEWLWGGFSVDNATLNRFFSLHYLMPFAIAGVTVIHLSLLHKVGSNNPLGLNKAVNSIPFYPYFYVKDLLAFFYLVFFLFFFVIYYPGTLGHPDNYIPANPMVTPAHIVPEWYFLPFYAILRSIPDKLGGVVAMGGSIALLLLLPFVTNSTIRNGFFRYIYKYAFWFLAGDFVLLGWLGQKPVEDPYINLGLVATIFYMAFLTVLLPCMEYYEALKNVKSVSDGKKYTVSFWSYKTLTSKIAKMRLVANSTLIEVLRATKDVSWTYVLAAFFAFIYLQNILKYLAA
jgi:ubiquinol-cytochrome c reductase cytochrome b subunit